MVLRGARLRPCSVLCGECRGKENVSLHREVRARQRESDPVVVMVRVLGQSEHVALFREVFLQT